MKRKQYIFGNWKMNNNLSQTKEFFANIEAKLANEKIKDVIMGIAIPSLNLVPVMDIASQIKVAAQNVYQKDEGAFTGEISVNMLKDAEIKYCIVGHSERRQIFGETDNVINQKVKKLLKNKIQPIFCLGETEEEYNESKTSSVCQNQIGKGFDGVSEEDAKNVIVAYEPIWAIGTGKTTTPEITQKTIEVIREKLNELYGEEISQSISILYGGSVKPGNINIIMAQPDIDGVLVGGASVAADSYFELYKNK